jgi:hypothetical protein
MSVANDLAREAQHLRAIADAEHAVAVHRAREQFAAERDAIDRAFDAEFDRARNAIDEAEMRRLRDRPRPEYKEARHYWPLELRQQTTF